MFRISVCMRWWCIRATDVICNVVKETLTQLKGEADFKWREVDIDCGTELRRKYNDEVPVVFTDGCMAFKYRLDGHQLPRVIAHSR